MDQGCEVVVEADTAANMGLNNYTTMDVAAIGTSCDVCVVVGGDGTMLGVSRHLARYGTPLIGINQGRLGFVTDISLEDFESTITPMLVDTVMSWPCTVFTAPAFTSLAITLPGTTW